MALWLAVAIALVASTGNSIGKALQKQATKNLPRFTVESKVLWMYLHSKEWLIGVAADMGGGVLMVAAYALAPVSIVQPVSGVGLVSLAVFSHFYLKERLHRWEWAAVGLAGIGTLGLGSEPTEGGEEHVNVLRVVVVFTVMLGGLGAAVLMQRRASFGGSSEAAAALRRSNATMCGLEAGVCFGLSAAACRIGLVLARRGVLWLPAGILGSLMLTSGGFVLQTRGLKDGNTVLVCTCAAVTAMISGVLVGLLALGERLPAGAAGKAHRLTCWGLILAGVTMIAHGPGGGQTLAALLASALPRSAWTLLPTDTALWLRAAAQKLDLPTTVAKPHAAHSGQPAQQHQRLPPPVHAARFAGSSSPAAGPRHQVSKSAG